MNSLSRALTRTFITIAFAGSAPVQGLSAQDGAGAAATVSRPEHFCFRGQPKPKCDRFMLTELTTEHVTYAKGVTVVQRSSFSSDSSVYEDRPTRTRLTGELGVMKNYGSHTALGLTALVGGGGGGPGTRIGAKIRYRRWLTGDGLAFDAGMGLTKRFSGNGPDAGYDFESSIAFNAQDYIALTTGFATRHVNGKTLPITFTGVRLGSAPALIGSAVLGTLVVVVAYSILSSPNY